MTRRIRAFVTGVLFLLALVTTRAAGPQTTQAPTSVPRLPMPAALAKTLDPVIDAAWNGFGVAAASAYVQLISQYWRLPGNPGYEATIDLVHGRLADKTSGVVFEPRPASSKTTPEISIDSYPNTGKGWDHSVGTLALVRDGQPDTVVLSKEKDHVALCINSFSTPEGGVVAPLVDVGAGADADFAGKELTGAVVIGDADVGQLWRRAVQMRGALGVISTSLGRYISPVPPGVPVPARETWDILQWGSVPYDEAKHGFGFKSSPRAAATLRAALKPGPAKVRVTVASTFSSKPVRTLIAEIPGRTMPNERIVLAAHVQEPGAGDNASGVATLAELARSLAMGIRAGKIPPPARTITFLWLDEIGGSRQWLRDHAEEAKGVRYMLSMDMTGEDVKKSGGSFLIERWPDPGAVWDRPWDPHSEWGRGNVRAESLKGDLLNDVHLAVCDRVARKAGWVVSTNPYEGGSDHTVFGSAGIPSLLNWHFTDRYYHSSFDTADKTSGPEMRNVGVAVASTAWLLASTDDAMAHEVASFVAAAGQARIDLETREGAKIAAAESNPDAARTREGQIIQAWKKWYGEAVQSVTRLVIGSATPDLTRHLATLAAKFQ